MDWDLNPLDLDEDTIVKLAIRLLLLKSLGQFQTKKVPELENMPDADRNLLNEKKAIFEELICKFPLEVGKEISKKERSDRNWKSTSLTYGEIEFTAFAEMIYLIKTKYNSLLPPGALFYDLGSGQGKSVIAAALVHDFTVCKGIELLESLFEVSLRMKNAYDEYIMPKDLGKVEIDEKENSNKEVNKEEKTVVKAEDDHIKEECNPFLVDWNGRKFIHRPEIKFECGDILEKNWLDGTLIFANSTCFDPFLMWKISKKAKLLRKDTIFITLTKRLPDYLSWDLLENYQAPMSWGDATIYIHCKRADPTEEDIKNAENVLTEEQFRKEMGIDQGKDQGQSEVEDDNLFADYKVPE